MEKNLHKKHIKKELSLGLYDRITGPPPSFRECVTYGKRCNVVNDPPHESWKLALLCQN